MVNQFRYVTMYLCLKLCNRVFLCVIVCKGLGRGKIRDQGNYRSRPGFPSVGKIFTPPVKYKKPGTLVFQRIPGVFRQKSNHAALYQIQRGYLDLVIGYGIAAFSPSPTTSTLCTFAIVLAGSFILMVMEYYLSKWVAWTKYPVDKLVPYSELKKHGVDTNITGKELDDMLNDVFRD